MGEGRRRLRPKGDERSLALGTALPGAADRHHVVTPARFAGRPRPLGRPLGPDRCDGKDGCLRCKASFAPTRRGSADARPTPHVPRRVRRVARRRGVAGGLRRDPPHAGGVERRGRGVRVAGAVEPQGRLPGRGERAGCRRSARRGGVRRGLGPAPPTPSPSPTNRTPPRASAGGASVRSPITRTLLAKRPRTCTRPSSPRRTTGTRPPPSPRRTRGWRSTVKNRSPIRSPTATRSATPPGATAPSSRSARTSGATPASGGPANWSAAGRWARSAGSSSRCPSIRATTGP